LQQGKEEQEREGKMGPEKRRWDRVSEGFQDMQYIYIRQQMHFMVKNIDE